MSEPRKSMFGSSDKENGVVTWPVGKRVVSVRHQRLRLHVDLQVSLCLVDVESRVMFLYYVVQAPQQHTKVTLTHITLHYGIQTGFQGGRLVFDYVHSPKCVREVFRLKHPSKSHLQP